MVLHILYLYVYGKQHKGEGEGANELWTFGAVKGRNGMEYGGSGGQSALGNKCLICR